MANPLNVLVVDDDADVLALVQSLLARLGYQSTLAQSAGEALDLLTSNRYDLVLSDIHMSGMNGMQLLRKILENYDYLPVILMTGYSEAHTLQDAMVAGADEYLTKPFKKSEIEVVLQRAFWRRMSTRHTDRWPSNAQDVKLG